MLPLILGALAAAGTGAQIYGQKISQDAQRDLYKEEKRRQQRYQQEAQLIADQSIQNASPPAAQQSLADNAAARSAAFNRITAAGRSTSAAPGAATVRAGPVGAAALQQAASVSAWNKILGGAQANLGAYADWGLERNLAALRAGQNLSVINNLAQGSSDTTAAEQADAAQAGAVWNMVGGLTQKAGLAGMQGGFG